MATVSRILARVCLGAILAVQACTFALGAGKATAAEESGRLDAGGEDAASVAAGREAMREENAGAETKGGPGREKRAGKAFMKVEGGPGPDGKAFPVDGGGQEAASPAGKAAERKEAAEQRHYADAEAGYSLKIPDGWRKVTEREVREVFRGMLKAFGKKAVEAVLQRPPVFFEGPNPRDPMKIWENFGVGHIPTTFTLDPDRLDEYRGMVERQLKSEETPYEDVRVSLARVSGILSLRIDYATRRRAVSPLKMLASHVLIPAEDRTLELVFIFDPSRSEEMERIIGEVLDSFVVTRPPRLVWSSKWTRVALLTAGGFVGGIALGLLLQRLATRRGSSASPPDRETAVGPPGKA